MNTDTDAIKEHVGVVVGRLKAVQRDIQGVQRSYGACPEDWVRMSEIEDRLIDIAKAWMEMTRSAQYGDEFVRLRPSKDVRRACDSSIIGEGSDVTTGVTSSSDLQFP